MNALTNTMQILNPIIPETDLSDKGYLRLHPGGIAKPCIETLKNGSRLLDDNFWVWQLKKQGDYPNFVYEDTQSPMIPCGRN